MLIPDVLLFIGEENKDNLQKYARSTLLDMKNAQDNGLLIEDRIIPVEWYADRPYKTYICITACSYQACIHHVHVPKRHSDGNVLSIFWTLFLANIN